MTELVWYAAYGSNMSRARFEHYLRGGTPIGANHAYPGCRDGSAPLLSRSHEIEAQLAFGGTSRTWGGGVAFVERGSREVAKARLYLITVEQFEDVFAQENWLPPGSVSVREALVPYELELDRDHTYGRGLWLGDLDGHPIVTLTQHAGARIAKPTAGYLRHIANGLREAHGMGPDEVVDYFSSKRGVAGEFTSEELRTTVLSER